MKHKLEISLSDLQDQSNLQLKSERERRELEQAHMKIVKQMESRLYQAENSNKVCSNFQLKSEQERRNSRCTWR